MLKMMKMKGFGLILVMRDCLFYTIYVESLDMMKNIV